MSYMIMPYILTIIFIALLVIGIYLRTSTARGKSGENKVRRVIGKTIDGEKYVINDIIFSDNGKTSQVDHIVINSRGVFVIETKNYSGTIY